MSRWANYKSFSPEVEEQIDDYWQSKNFRGKPMTDWQLKRLRAIYLLGIYTTSSVAVHCGISRQTVAAYRKLVKTKGLDSLFQRRLGAGAPGVLNSDQKKQFVVALENAEIQNTNQAVVWIFGVTGVKMSESGVRKMLRRIHSRRWRFR